MPEQEPTPERAEPSLRSRALFIVVATVLAGLAAAWYQSRSVFFESAEYAVSDFAVALLGDQLESGHDAVALALIREETLVDAPAYSPIDRRILAQAIRELDQLGARAIGLDVVFDKATDPAADAALIEAIRTARTPIVLGRFQDRTGAGAIPQQRAYQDWFLGEALEPSTPDGRSTVTIGYVNTLTETDGVIRRFAEPDESAPEVPSFAEALARAAGVEDAAGAGRIAWLKAPEDGFQTFSRLYVEEDLVETSASPAPPTPFLVLPVVEDRVVIVGAAFRVMADYHATPLNVGFGDETIGVEIQAQMTAQLLDGRMIRDAGPIGVWALTTLGFAFGLILSFNAEKRWLVEIGVVVVAYLSVVVACFAALRVILPVVGPAIAWGLAIILAKTALMIEESRENRRRRRVN